MTARSTLWLMPAGAIVDRTDVNAGSPREELRGGYGIRSDLTATAVDAFEDALHAGSEEQIQIVLTENPYLIQYAIRETGHHGTWVYPKQMIRPKAATGDPGLIPDFLVVTRSSLGDHWWVDSRPNPALPAVAGGERPAQRSPPLPRDPARYEQSRPGP